MRRPRHSPLDLHRPSRAGAVFLRRCLAEVRPRPKFVLFGWALLSQLTVSARADVFDQLRLNWAQLLTGGTNYSLSDNLVSSRLSSLTNSALSYWNSMSKAPGSAYLWSDLGSTNDSGQISTAYSRLRTMSLAYVTYGSALRGNLTLAADIQTGLNWMYANRYNESKAEYDNWFDWEIGAPLSVTDLATLMYDALGLTGLSNSLNAVNHFVPSPTNGGHSGTFTGANLADKLRIVAVRGAVVKDTNQVASARDALGILFFFATTGDGFYADGTFIQHGNDPYNGAYGAVALADVSLMLPFLNGSPWQCQDPAQTNVSQWVWNSFEPLIYFGACMDLVRGRAISRSNTQDHVAGGGIIQSILSISQFASPPDATRMRSMVKYWAQVDTFRSFTNNLPLPLISVGEQLMADTNTAPRGELLGHWLFAGMDRSVHLRPGWGLGLSLSSSRIYNYESLNGENLHGWFTGDGVTYVYNNDLSQFSDDFWATVDPYALPGTTVETTTRANAAGQSYLSSKPWVGGATLFTNGAAGMDLNPYSSPLSGKKSWFMFQDGVACLGTGINCANGATVQTTVENRKLGSANTNAFTADGQDLPTTLGWSTNLIGSTWCALAGAGGYYFPGTANLSVLRQARTNSWSQINTGGSTNLTTRNYLTLWFNHGVQPTNATYAYVLLPNYSTEQMAGYAANPNLLVLENSTNAQAVKVPSSGVVAANFWNDTPWSVDLISCNRKASIVTQQTPLNLCVAVSDPTQLNSSNMVVSLNRPANSVAFLDPAIVVSQVRPTIQMTVNVKGAAGRSLSAGFNLQNSPPWLAPIANHTINAGYTLTLTNTATDPDLPYQTLTFGLLNPPAGAAITTLNTTNAFFTWRPAITQAGTTNVIAVTVTDNGSPSMSATQTFVVTVTQPTAPGLALIPGSTGQFALSVSGTAGPDYLIQASTNLITWTTLYATSSPALPFVWVDSQRSLFGRRFYRALLGPASPSFPPIPNHVVNAGVTLSLSNQATDPHLPPQALVFSLLAGPTNATINPTNGAFVWRPGVAQAGTSNTVTILASNAGDTRLNATQTFGLTVNPMAAPTLSQLSFSNGRPTFSILGDFGPDYSVQDSTNLHDWGTLFTTNSPVLPFFWTDQTATNFRARFYRALVGP